ncbi:MAG: glycosyltransferase family 4 protein [Clostridia bacterium]|nr:glycosyltransferase family 4 protein [Clostridia bacterium]
MLFVANVAKEHILKFHVPTIKHFKENGWAVDVACSGPDEVPYCDRQFHTSWTRSPFTPKTFKGIKELKKIIADGGYDIVYCHTPVGGLVARMASKKARKNGTKVIYFAHGLHFFKGASLVNWLTYYPVEVFLSYKTDIFFALNNEDFAAAHKRFNKKLTIRQVPGVGANFDRLNVEAKAALRAQYRQELDIPEDAPVLIYIAELIKNKNQTMLVDTLRVLHESHPNAYLLLVGPEHDDGAVAQYVSKQGLDNRIKLLGWRSDVGALMNTADIYVASSLREGFPINLLEAMYCGLPVIATKNRGHVTPLVHGENGFLVDINDHQAMASYAAQLLEDPALYDKLSHIDVSRYDCDRIAGELYETILDCTQQ